MSIQAIHILIPAVSPRGSGRRRETLHVERRPHSPPSGPNRRFPPERHRTTRILLACTLSPQGSGRWTLPHCSRGMQAPSSRKISTGYQPAVTGFPPRDSSRFPGSLRAGPREDAPTGDPGRDLRFRDLPADATRPDQLRIDPNQASTLNCHADIRPGASGHIRLLAATRAADSFTESRARWA